jgi:signal transduction histidine kinase
MGSIAESAAPLLTLPDPGQTAGFPFRGPGLLVRVAPFAVVTALAEVSLALPPGVQSQSAVIASIVLLLAVAASFALPWPRLPAWATVLVPLAYTGWVLALILAAGETAGVGIVILVPLVWTALFHQRWESACVVVAIVAVEVITSLVPTADADSVIARRVLLWAALGTLISVATHGLRDRIAHSRRESARLQEQLREAIVLQDRDRIAAGLKDEVVQRVFAVGLALQSAASQATQPGVRRRVEAAAGDLDQVLRLLRDTVFGLEQQVRDRGLRREILELCEGMSPAPEVSFSGPLDGALHPGTGTRLIQLLREALIVIEPVAVPVSIGVTSDEQACVTVVEATARPQAADVEWAARKPAGLVELAARAGASIDIEPISGGVRYALRLPLDATAALGPRPGRLG